MYRRSRPTYLPMYGYGSNSTQSTLPTYGYDTNSTHQKPNVSTYNYNCGFNTSTPYSCSNMNRLQVPGYQSHSSHYVKPRTPTPPSPILDQVLTDFRPGPGVVWFCEKKRDNSKPAFYKKLLVSLVLLATFGLACYMGMSFVRMPRMQMPEDVTVSESTFSEDDMISATHEPVILASNLTQENVISAAEDSVILARNFSSEGLKIATGDPVRIKIVYSVNEDLESTVEIIEG